MIEGVDVGGAKEAGFFDFDERKVVSCSPFTALLLNKGSRIWGVRAKQWGNVFLPRAQVGPVRRSASGSLQAPRSGKVGRDSRKPINRSGPEPAQKRAPRPPRRKGDAADLRVDYNLAISNRYHSTRPSPFRKRKSSLIGRTQVRRKHRSRH